jgi:hypothetical protein
MAKRVSQFDQEFSVPSSAWFLIEKTDGKYYKVAPADITGAGDMTKAVYDPNVVNGDAFDPNNMQPLGSTIETFGADFNSDTTRTDATSKEVKLGLAHRTNSAQPVAMMYGVSGIGSSSIRIGGGHISMNAATDIGLFTAATDTTPTGTARLSIGPDGSVILSGGDLIFTEGADHVTAPAAGFGKLWVRNDTPNVLVYTDDAGTDTVLGVGSVTVDGTPADNQIAIWTGASTLEGDVAFTFDTATNLFTVGNGVINSSSTGNPEIRLEADTDNNGATSTAYLNYYLNGTAGGTGVLKGFLGYEEVNTRMVFSSAEGLTLRTSAGNSDITFDPNGTGDVLVASGNVGIGIDPPISKLDVRGGTTLGFVTHTGDGDADVNLFGDGTNAQSGNFASALRLFGGASQTRHMYLQQINNGSAVVASTFADLYIQTDANNANVVMDPQGAGRTIHVSSTDPTLHLTNSPTFDHGAYFGTPDSNELVIGIGTDFVYAAAAVTTWTPKETSAGVIRIDNGTFEYYADSGLTVDVPYSPTRQFYCDETNFVIDSNNFWLNAGDIVITETADHATTPTAARGQIWVKNDAAQKLVFTDDAGDDVLISADGITWPNAVTLDAAAAAGFNIQTNSLNRLSIDSAGVASFFKRMDVYNGSSICVFGANDAADGTRTDATSKHAKIGCAHYTNAEEPMAMVRGFSSVANNTLHFGGGSGAMNAATVISLYTGATTTTTTGTERMRVDNAGNMQLYAGDLVFNEKADHAFTPVGTKGSLWVRNDTPNVLVFTDDAGTDTVLGAGGGGGDVTKVGTPVDNQIGVWTGDGTLEGDANLTWDGSILTAKNGYVDFWNGSAIARFGADSGSDTLRTDATAKVTRIGMPHYTNAEEPAALIVGVADSGSNGNEVRIGGGSNTLNAANILSFFTDTTSITLTGTERMRIDSAGNIITYAGDLVMTEKADHAFTPAAGTGQLWVKNTVPATLIYTDDAGTDFDLTAAGGGNVTKVGTPVDNEIGVWTGDGTIEGDTNFTWDGSGMDIKGILDIWNGAGIFQIGGDSGSNVLRTNNTTKVYRMGFAHYANAEEPCQIMSGSCTSTASSLNLGGGTSAMNACESVSIYTAANTTTTTGTRRFNVDTSGNITIDTGNLRLSASTGNIGLNGKTAGATYPIYGGQNQNAETSFRCDNTTSGTAAVAGLVVTANAGGGTLKAHSSAFTTSGAAIADGVKLEANSSASGGLALVAAESTAVVRVYAGGAADADLVATFDAARNLELAAGDLVFNEAADHSFTPVAAHASLWVKNDTPNSLIFTDDAGDDFDLVHTPHASIYVTTSITNTANGTPAKLAGAGVTASNIVSEFTHTTPNRITYTGATTKIFTISASMTITHSASNVIQTLSFAKNGTNIANSSIRRKIGTGGDIGASSLEWTVSLATNDYIEVFCDSDTAGTSTVSEMVLQAHQS